MKRSITVTKGEGEDSIILHGLDFVAKRVKSTEAALHGSLHPLP
jgi:hypothetical protein